MNPSFTGSYRWDTNSRITDTHDFSGNLSGGKINLRRQIPEKLHRETTRFWLLLDLAGKERGKDQRVATYSRDHVITHPCLTARTRRQGIARNI